ncbi:MAG: hypothetical protein OXG33_01455 [Chloroflexi bacterium]|nr:hypothetical protein [Chloroflexota bacterium]
MENDPKFTEQMLVEQLTAACEEQIDALRRTCKAHEDLFGPLDAERKHESDTLLRLRKVYCHAIAVASCPMNQWAIHAMAPDIRTSFQHLKTMVRDGVCVEVHEPGDRNCPRPRCFSTWDGLLAPYSHPTTTVLMFFSSAGGLRMDDVRCLSKLCLLLYSLSSCYAMVLDVEALRLGLTSEEDFANIAERANPHEVLESAYRYIATM